MMRRVFAGGAVAALMLVQISACPSASAIDFGRDDSGNVKFTMKGLPFLEDDGGKEETECRREEYDPDDEEYTTDSIGRKVPVRTHKAGSAISTR